MLDSRNWDESSTSRKAALKVLEKAKKKEAQKIANGAHYCKIGNRTRKLNFNK